MSFENSFPSDDANRKAKIPEKLKSNINIKEDKNIGSKESNNNNNKIIEINFNANLDIKKIKELNSNSVDLIFEEKFEIALDILKKIELFLEVNIIEAKYNFNKKILIIILHNLSCCYQKIKDYTNCIQYLDSVLYHFDKDLEKKHKIKIDEEYFGQNINKDLSNYSLLGDYILELRFSAKFHLQMCAALSQANRHLEALQHAKLAGLICEDNLIKIYYLFNQMKSKPNIFNINNEDGNEIDNNINNIEKMKVTEQIINDLYNKIKNIKQNFYPNDSEKSKNAFDSYLKYRKREIRKNEKKNILLNNIRNIIGNEEQKEDWLQLLNIGNVIYLSPLNEEDLDLDSDPKYEILRDALLEKIVMLTVSYFCISMGMYQLSKDKNNKKTNGEFFLNQTVLFSEQYLPVSCPLVKYYINSYYKYYEKDLEIIPEGKILDYKIELIRNEIEKNKDIQSFVKIQKINYSKNENGNKINTSNIISNLNIKTSIVDKNNNNKIIMKGINISQEKKGNEKGKIKIPLGLKFNLNFADIINNNENENEAINIVKGPQNTKISISNDSKNGNNNGENYQLFFNKKSINIAEKTKIKDLPKFKLNFNKINNLDKDNREENKISLGTNFQSLSNKIKQMNNNKIKKINTKITKGNKINRNSVSGSKKNKSKIKNNSGYKTDRPKSNQRPNNNNDNDTIIIDNKDKKSKKDIKRNSFIIPFHSYKYFPKTSRYGKSPISGNKNKKKGNLTDRTSMNKNKNNNKSLKKNTQNLIKKMNYMNKAGYQTHRELTKKINLDINNSKKKSKYSKDNNKNERKNKSIDKVSNKIIISNNKNKIYAYNNKFNNNFLNNKVNNNNLKIKSNNNNNIINNLYKNLFNYGNKNNNIYRNINGFNKNSTNTGKMNNIKSFPLNNINNNPFKI